MRFRNFFEVFINKNKLKNRELIIISEEFYNMFQSGCDVFTILDTVIYSSSERISNACRLVRQNIEMGKSLSESFALSNCFPKLFVNMVYAGELSGKTDVCFKLLSDYYSREDSLQSKLKNASIYPIILLIVSLIAINIVFVFVIPNFQNSFLSDDMQLGFTTRMLFATSSFIRRKGLFLFIGTIALILYFVYFFKKDRMKRMRIQNKVYKLPVFKKINTIAISEKFSRVLSNLMDSGVNASEAVEIAISIIDNPFVEVRLSNSVRLISEGNTISDSLESSNVFPRIFISMIKSGEESGRFSETLDNVSNFYKKELDHEVDKMLKLLEPCMILFMGILIGFVIIGLMTPIMSTISNITG